MEEDYKYELSSPDNENPDEIYPEEQKRRTIVMLLVGFIFLFTIISILCTFTISKALVQKEKETEVGEQEETSNKEDISINNSEDTGVENEKIDSNVQPLLSDVKTIFEELQSYRFKRTNIPESYIMEGKFQSADKEYVIFKSNGITNHEIAVGEVIMSKEGEGEWKEIEEGYFLGNHNYFLSLFNVSSDLVSIDSVGNEFWKYSFFSDGKNVSIRVSKGSLLINSIEMLKNEQLIEQIEFSDHNSEEINIELP